MTMNFLKTVGLCCLVGVLFSFDLPKPTEKITPATALDSYLKNGD